jgi:catechol 2,3-dioxygenase-like lactoylglutathione lyase family enzyme
MSRLQLALNVGDMEAAIAFYSALFDTAPAKRRPGYANFAIADPPLKLVLIEGEGEAGSINHLGVEVESTEGVDAEQARLAAAGLVESAERGTTCCYARQDKFWVQGTSSNERWEVYTVLEDSRPDLEGVTDLELSDLAGDSACCTDATADTGTAATATRAEAPSHAEAKVAACC